MPPRKRERPGARQVTLQDVADAAGVSLGAASVALRGASGPLKVSAETRARVLEAAQRLHYKPNIAARALAGQCFKAVGVLAAHYVWGSYFSRVLQGMALRAAELGYHIVLVLERSRAALAQAPVFSERLIDGVIVPAEMDDDLRAALHESGLPHVWVNAGVDEPVNCVNPDEVQGMECAVAHLRELGHRRIGYVPHIDTGGDPYHEAATRRRAYEEAMRRQGLEPLAVENEFPSVEACTRYCIETCTAPPQRATALMAYSDAVAGVAARLLLDRGLRIPADVSIVGHEGVAWHEYTHPPVTTVCAPVYDLGRASVDLLVAQIDSGQPAASVRLPHQLLVQESTGPAPV